VAFGVATDTLDAAGTETDRRPMPDLTREGLEAVLPRFLGTIAQIPPMVSAIKVDGRRLHERARAGEVVERAPRTVRIDRIEIEEFVAGDHPRARLLVECGSGTYIRSLAADLGEAAGGCAHLAWPRPEPEPGPGPGPGRGSERAHARRHQPRGLPRPPRRVGRHDRRLRRRPPRPPGPAAPPPGAGHRAGAAHRPGDLRPPPGPGG